MHRRHKTQDAPQNASCQGEMRGLLFTSEITLCNCRENKTTLQWLTWQYVQDVWVNITSQWLPGQLRIYSSTSVLTYFGDVFPPQADSVLRDSQVFSRHMGVKGNLCRLLRPRQHTIKTPWPHSPCDCGKSGMKKEKMAEDASRRRLTPILCICRLFPSILLHWILTETTKYTFHVW